MYELVDLFVFELFCCVQVLVVDVFIAVCGYKGSADDGIFDMIIIEFKVIGEVILVDVGFYFCRCWYYVVLEKFTVFLFWEGEFDPEVNMLFEGVVDVGFEVGG